MNRFLVFFPFSFYSYLPNFITFLRICLTPLTYYFINHNQSGYAFLCFAFAGISDAIDGFLARRWNVISKVGRILDPIADKALMFMTFVTLGLLGKIPVWLVLLVIGRDILILLCGYLTFLLALNIRLTPILSSKLNTFFQIVLVGTVLLSSTPFYQSLFPFLYRFWILIALFVVTAFTTIYSGLQYAIYFTKELRHIYRKGQK